MNTQLGNINFPRGFGYAEFFRAVQPQHDPRHIEAYVRVEHGTLSGLSAWQLRNEADIAADCIAAGGVEAAERLAQSFGL